MQAKVQKECRKKGKLTMTRTTEELTGACSEVLKHTKCPEGYLQWHYWVERMAKTHKQIQCPGCGLYRIWRRKHGRYNSNHRSSTQGC